MKEEPINQPIKPIKNNVNFFTLKAKVEGGKMV